ncbi:acyl carrier protein [Streptomyces sp. NPDC000594]|uniref:acyl carrier protein n=1 Tax=Streptomyces sp. NPDC000594 TaxID=3154261 RepID=UPI00332F199D
MTTETTVEIDVTTDVVTDVTTAETDRTTDFVLGVIRDMLNMPLPRDVSPATPLGAGGLELESLSLVELTVHVEREYAIQFSDEAVDGLATMTLGELVGDIGARRGGATGTDPSAAAGADAGPGAVAGAGGTDPAALTLDDVKRLLALSQIIPAERPETIADDEEIVLDSLTLVWFLYQLGEQHGIDLEIDHAQAAVLTTVAALHSFLQGSQGAQGSQGSQGVQGSRTPVGAVPTGAVAP